MGEVVSRETSDSAYDGIDDGGDIVELEYSQNPDGSVESPGFKQLYRRFRENKLSRRESAFNAAYLYCNDKYYSSDAAIKEKYKNIYAHPGMWYKNASKLWRHNKWSIAVGALEIIPAIGKLVSFTGDKLRGAKDKLKGVWRNFEYTHVAMRSFGCVFVSLVLLAGAVAFGALAFDKIHGMTKLEPVLGVFIDGKYAGNVLSVAQVETAQKTFDDSRSAALHKAYHFEGDVKFVPQVAVANDVISQGDLASFFEAASNEWLVDGYGLVVDGTFICAAESRECIKQAIQDSLKNEMEQFKQLGVDVDDVAYYNRISVVAGKFPGAVFKDREEIRALFGLGKVRNQDIEKLSGVTTMLNVGHEAEEPGDIQAQGDDNGQLITAAPQSSIVIQGENADTNRVPSYVTDLENNPGNAQQQTTTNDSTLDVVVYRSETLVEEVPYEVQNIEDPEMVEGRTKTVTQGVSGSCEVVYNVGYLGHDELSRTEVSRTMIVEPVTEVVIVGTRPMSEEEKRVASKGYYIWPCPDSHRISSNYGWRTWGGTSNEFHKGLDISREDHSYYPYIVAADGGTVIRADSDSSGYGLCILIEHDDGTVTRYAHCRKLLVEKGQKVAQGENIAIMGDTGAATGVHLHIEFLVDGVLADPTKYLPMP